MAGGNFFKKGVRITLWALALVTALCASFLGIMGLLSFLRDTPFLGSENVFLGTICTIIAWFFVVVFHFGKETIHMAVYQPATFLGNARRVLAEMGYEVTRPNVDTVGTRHSFRFLLFSRGIHIHFADRQAHITGPKIWVDLLRRRLRVQNFLGRNHPSPEDTQIRGSATLLKRVQICMRVTPENLEEVTRHVLKLLAKEAEVVCEVSLLAQSDSGIRNSVVEHHIRGWLNNQGIAADIRKDVAQMMEPSTILMPGKLRRKVTA